MRKLYFKSQTEYGIYGGNICTPVCCIVASNYLLRENNRPISNIFSSYHMDKIMKACHHMYSECFSQTGVNMMLSDVQRYFPPSLNLFEIAGMTRSGETESVEDLLVQPLCKLMELELRKSSCRVVIVTRLGHTVCYLMDGLGGVLLFDPLEASIKDVCGCWAQTIPSKNSEYSGLIVTKTAYVGR